MSKQYGLIIPGKKPANQPPKANFTKPSIFGSDSDSDDQAPKKFAPVGPGASEKRQARKIQEKALEEDPTIFQYDELYDDIESKRNEEKTAKSQEARKPKYIGRLLEYAERRKIENERRVERTVQKEREREGEEFKDKEAFVTSAYRKKLEELRQAEEREKREDYLEAIGDVTKQQDLGGFYRHLYEQKLKIKEEKEEKTTTSEAKEPDQESIQEQKEDSAASNIQIKPAAKPRAYRKRRSSDDDDDDSEAVAVKESAAKKTHLQSNLDADSDFSIDSSSDSETEDNANKKSSTDVETIDKKDDNQKESKVECKSEPNTVDPDDKETKDENNTKEKPIGPDDIKKEKEDEAIKPKAPKLDKKDIWKKRTVGEVFDAALARYYERKAARNG